MPLNLNQNNYYGTQSNQDYMSVHQYLDFLKCEESAMAKVWGGYEEPKSKAFLVGSYVHAWNDGTISDFKLSTPELFSNKGTLYSDYKHADTMIDVLSSDPFCMFMLEGEKEVILTAELFGCWWKAKVDVLNVERKRIIDLKTSACLNDKVWNDNERMYQHALEAYGNLTQLSVYSEIERVVNGHSDRFEPYFVIITKEDPPDKAIVSIDTDRIMWELEQVEKNMPRVLDVKNGREKPVRCEKCRYCRETKKVSRVLHYSEL